MRTYLAHFVLLTFFSLANSPAHATGIDNFTLVGEGHIYTYSLPDSAVINDHQHGVTWDLTASTTIDGVSGYTTTGQYYVPRLSLPSMILHLPSSTDQAQLVLWGPEVVRATVIPIDNPIPVTHPDDLFVTFVPGTYQFTESKLIPRPGPAFTLTIAADTSATPEPSSLILLATGCLSVIGMVSSRHGRIG